MQHYPGYSYGRFQPFNVIQGAYGFIIFDARRLDHLKDFIVACIPFDDWKHAESLAYNIAAALNYGYGPLWSPDPITLDALDSIS